jgi:voltage-gated potassium channel
MSRAMRATTIRAMRHPVARLVAFTFSPQGLRVAVPAALAAIIATGLLFAAVEGRTIGDGLWWAFVTVTTVGYGDITPETAAGKVIAVALMTAGIGFLLVLAGAIVEHFVAGKVQQVESEIREVELDEHIVLQRLDEISRRVDRLAAALAEQDRRAR